MMKAEPITDDTEPAGPKIDDEAVVELKERFAHEKALQEFKLGKVGKIWGDRYEKPGNISAIILLLLVGMLGVLFIIFGNHVYFKDILAALVSTITLILGYLFGSSDSPPRE